MTYKIKTEKFNGPLDLLLQLIEQHKLTITDISIGQVTDQYLEYLEKIEDKDAEELSDFLVVAARLLLLKSKALLPFLESEEEEVDDLEKQLKLYKEFQDAAKKIADIIKEERFTFARPKPPIKTEVEYRAPQELKLQDLKLVFLSVLKRLDPLVKLPKQAIEKTVSLQEKITSLKSVIATQKKFGFKHLIKDAKSRTEVIMSFLAILELVKQEELKVKQTNNFDDIILERISR